jgi:hypothetical protein
MISEQNRNEFEQLGLKGVQGQIDHALYDGQKQREAYEWLEEKVHGPDRALAREQIEIAREAKDTAKAANTRANWALAIAVISAVAAIVVPHYWK